MSGYIGPIPVPQGIQNKETFTATAGQTTFNTNGYTDGAFISVYLNGVRLINGTDYTATNGSDVVLTTAASASDVVDFETFNSFSLASQQFENITTKNPTHEDTDGGRESAISFKGEQSGGEISTLAQIQASHDGTSDDQKGDLIFKTNDGSDNDAPTERMRIDSVGTVTITNDSNDSQLILESTDADASSGPVLELFRNSASPADNDLGGAIQFHAENDAGEKIQYQLIQAYMPDVSDGSEDGAFQQYIMKDGTSIQRMEHSPTETVFNQDSADVDFRIESDGEANMFHVDGAANSIGIGETGLAAYSSAWGTVDTTRHLSIKGSAYGVLHLKNSGTPTHYTMGAGDGSLYGAYDAVGGKHHTRYVSNTSTQINPDASDLDFIVKGNTNTTGLVYNADDEVFGVFTNSTATALNVGANFKRNGRDSAWINIGHHAAEGHGYSYMTFNYNSTFIGGITQSGTTGVSFDTSSDYRLKENVNYTFDATSRLKQLKPARFNFIAEPDRTVDGFLAHEVESIVPQAVHGTKDAVDDDGNAVMQSIDHSKLVPLLVKTIQELEARITTLEAE